MSRSEHPSRSSSHTLTRPRTPPSSVRTLPCAEVWLTSGTQKVNTRVEYVTDTEPNLARTLRLSQIVPTLLPVAVNVQDFFRATRYSTEVSLARSMAHFAPRIFTRFSVSTTSNQHVRIRSAKLVPESDSPGQLRISPCTPRSSDILVRRFIPTPPWLLSNP